MEKLFTAETRTKLDKAGLMVVDKTDFETVMRLYDEVMKENRVLKLQLKGARNNSDV